MTFFYVDILIKHNATNHTQQFIQLCIIVKTLAIYPIFCLISLLRKEQFIKSVKNVPFAFRFSLF